MEIRFNRTGAERKELVAAISGITGWAPVYQNAPTFAYVVQDYTIDRDGTLVYDERTDAGSVRELLAELAARGIVPDAGAFAGDDNPAPGDSVEGIRDDGTHDIDTPDTLSIAIPLPGFTDADFDKLEKLVASKATLIRKAVGRSRPGGASDLTVEREGDNLCFSWFAPGSSTEEVAGYTQFVTALCNMAKKQQRVVAKEKPADSEKFAFRCFLLRLGFIGDSYASARKILLANLPGDGSFKSGKRGERTANTVDNAAPSEAGEGDMEARCAEQAHSGLTR